MIKVYSPEIKKRVETEENFVTVPRYNYSLDKMMNYNPDGYSREVIANALAITDEELEELYEEALRRLREMLNCA